MEISGILRGGFSRVPPYARRADAGCIGGDSCLKEAEPDAPAAAPAKNSLPFCSGGKPILGRRRTERAVSESEICGAAAGSGRIPPRAPELSVRFMRHTEFSRRISACTAVVRAGKAAPSARTLLQSACLFYPF